MALVVMVLIAPLSMFFTTKVNALFLLAQIWTNHNPSISSLAPKLNYKLFYIDEKRSGSNDESQR